MMERLTKRITENLIELSAKANPTQYVNSPQRVHLKHPFWNVFNRLCKYEDLEEQGLLLKLPESDWNDLIKQLAIIIANDFIVYCDEREFIINQFFSLEYDEELRFSATCRCFNGTENDWWCDEECEHGEDGKGCYITFTFSDIGKTVFLTKEEAEKELQRIKGNG